MGRGLLVEVELRRTVSADKGERRAGRQTGGVNPSSARLRENSTFKDSVSLCCVVCHELQDFPPKGDRKPGGGNVEPALRNVGSRGNDKAGRMGAVLSAESLPRQKPDRCLILRSGEQGLGRARGGRLAFPGAQLGGPRSCSEPRPSLGPGTLFPTARPGARSRSVRAASVCFLARHRLDSSALASGRKVPHPQPLKPHE